MRVVGLDGWRAGWVAVELVSGRFRAAAAFATLDLALAAYPASHALAVDMPIGLPARGRREADQLARQRLGGRRSCVFYCPPRDILMTEPYAAANELSKRRHGFGISKQSYMLRPKILEVDRAIGDGATVYEAHPEVAFAELVGAELPPKKTYAGQRRREAALRSVGIELPHDLGAAGLVPPDDVFDAAAVAHVAQRIALGVAESLPSAVPRDGLGRQMAIWF